MKYSIAERLRASPCTIVYAGTSLSVQKAGYRPNLHRFLCDWSDQPHSMVLAAFGGVGSPGVLAMLDRWVLSHKPIICFVETSVVDQGKEGIPSLVPDALYTIIRRLRESGCEPVMLHFPRTGDHGVDPVSVVATHEKIATLTETTSITVLAPVTEASRSRFFIDFVHLTPEAGVLAANFVANTLFELLPELYLGPIHETPILDLRLERPSFSDVIGEHPSVGLFRLVEKYLSFGPDSTLIADLRDARLYGLLHVVGPHSAGMIVNGSFHCLRDSWSHRDRLHATFFLDMPTGPIQITSLGDQLTPGAELRVVDLITLHSV
jgi:hypothetical protein